VILITYLQIEPKLRKRLTIIPTTYNCMAFTETALNFYVLLLVVTL